MNHTVVRVFYHDIELGLLTLDDDFLHCEQPMPVGTILTVQREGERANTVRVRRVAEAVLDQKPGMFIE